MTNHSLDETSPPFSHGQGARLSDVSITSNPYAKGSRQHREWKHGWLSMDDDLKESERLAQMAKAKPKVPDPESIKANLGGDAARAGIGRSANPHPRGSKDYHDWDRDWQSVKGEDEESGE